MLLGERAAGGEHVVVHLRNPAEEAVEVEREAGLAHAVDGDAVLLFARRGLVAPAREHVDGDPLADELLGELAHVTSKAALDHRGVLPGEDQDAVGHRLDPISRELRPSPTLALQPKDRCPRPPQPSFATAGDAAAGRRARMISTACGLESIST